MSSKLIKKKIEHLLDIKKVKFETITDIRFIRNYIQISNTVPNYNSLLIENEKELNYLILEFIVLEILFYYYYEVYNTKENQLLSLIKKRSFSIFMYCIQTANKNITDKSKKYNNTIIYLTSKLKKYNLTKELHELVLNNIVYSAKHTSKCIKYIMDNKSKTDEYKNHMNDIFKYHKTKKEIIKQFYKKN